MPNYLSGFHHSLGAANCINYQNRGVFTVVVAHVSFICHCWTMGSEPLQSAIHQPKGQQLTVICPGRVRGRQEERADHVKYCKAKAPLSSPALLFMDAGPVKGTISHVRAGAGIRGFRRAEEPGDCENKMDAKISPFPVRQRIPKKALLKYRFFASPSPRFCHLPEIKPQYEPFVLHCAESVLKVPVIHRP